MSRARWAAVVVLLAAAVFAWEGGTFSEPEYRALKRELAAKSAEIATMTRQVDSLKSFRDSIRNNPLVQERVARENFGMARPGEMTFRITVDSTLDSARVEKGGAAAGRP